MNRNSSSPPQQQQQPHHQQQQQHQQLLQQHSHHHQYNQQHKREDKRDDRNKIKNYPYDPCKIVGFQNKETNDFALSMLKAQGIQPPPEELLHHDASAITVSTANAMPPMPIQVQSPPQPNTFMAMPIYNATSIHGHPSVQMQAITTTQMGEYQWNIGDHCLAKYWDDEKVRLFYLLVNFKKIQVNIEKHL